MYLFIAYNEESIYVVFSFQKVVARSLHIEDEKYNEVGESLLIPEDYKGILYYLPFALNDSYQR